MPSTAGPRTPRSEPARVPHHLAGRLGGGAHRAGRRRLVPAADAKAATGPAAFVGDYRTDTLADRTPGTNAVVRVLGGFGGLWRTGSAWNTGTPLRPDILRADLRCCARVTAERTDAEAEEAFVHDRRHQSYALIAGLGPLAGPYRTGAKAVTSITGAPDGTPAATVGDAVPADAPAGSALGAGAHDSALGKVAELVDTVPGPYASGNPAKCAYQYPRPWAARCRSWPRPGCPGGFERIEVNSEGLRAVPVYTAEGLSVRLVRR